MEIIRPAKACVFFPRKVGSCNSHAREEDAARASLDSRFHQPAQIGCYGAQPFLEGVRVLTSLCNALLLAHEAQSIGQRTKQCQKNRIITTQSRAERTNTYELLRKHRRI